MFTVLVVIVVVATVSVLTVLTILVPARGPGLSNISVFTVVVDTGMGGFVVGFTGGFTGRFAGGFAGRFTFEDSEPIYSRSDLLVG